MKFKKLTALFCTVTILLTAIVFIIPSAAGMQVGTYCGPNAKWMLDLDTGVLKITGTGEIVYFSTVGVDGAKKDLIKSILIYPGITSICENAFSELNNLTSVYIAPTVQTIGTNAFSSCRNLKSVYIDDMAAWCNITFASMQSNPLCYADDFYLNNVLLTEELIIPQGVEIIKSYVFYNWSSYSTLILPSSLKTIGVSNFNLPQHIEQVIYCGTEEEYRKNIWEDFGNAEISYHRLGDITVTKEPTHTETGEQCASCDICNQELTSPIEKLKEHTYTYVPVDQFAHKSVCECGHILQSYTTHTRNEGTVLVEATHLTQGEISFTCVDCGESWKEYSKKLPDHSYTAIEKYSEAQHAQKCACGNAIYEDHNWDDGVVVTPASKDNAGLEAYTCTDCGETKTEIIPQKEGEGCNATLLDNSAFLLLIGGAMLTLLKKRSY